LRKLFEVFFIRAAPCNYQPYLLRQAGKRAKIVIADAMREIQGMLAEASRAATESLAIPGGWSQNAGPSDASAVFKVQRTHAIRRQAA